MPDLAWHYTSCQTLISILDLMGFVIVNRFMMPEDLGRIEIKIASDIWRQRN